ncbi:RRP12-like protein [Zophobas morio]|uniref:RRP12-like protein n=1 Tax=Zophobas morio TaxID=2755281 RepID=UPI003082AD5C
MTVKVPTSKPLPWKKGQSCVSNPVTATHREAARELYKFNFLDSDCLSATTFATERSKISQVSRVSRATTSSRKTERFPNTTGNTSLKEAQLEETLAKSTELTDAEEVKGTLQDVFEIVFRFVNSPLASHRKLCAILQCVRDVIGSQKEQNETAYYALFLNLLEKRSKVVEDEPTLAALSYLLSLVVDRTPTEVLLQTFPRCSQVVTETFQIHQKGSTSLLKSLVHILRGLLVAQNSESWKHVKTKGVFKLLVELALSPRPKLRRKAQDSIYKILSTPFVDFQKEHPIASFLWRNIYKKLLLGFSGEDTKLIHNLTLLQSVVEFLPSQVGFFVNF